MLPLFDAQCTVHTLLFNLLHKARTSSYIQESTSKERVSLFLYSRSKYPFFTPLKYRTSASMKFIYISLKRTHLSRTGLKKGWLCLKQVPKKGRIVLSNKWPPKAQWSQTGFLLYTCTVQCTECTLRYTTVCFEYQFLSRGAVHLQNPPTRSRAAGLLARRRCPAVAAAAKPLERRRRRPPLGLDSCRRRRGAARSRDALAAWRRSACVHKGGGPLWIFAKPNKTLKSKRGTSQMGSFYFVVININVLGFMFC